MFHFFIHHNRFAYLLVFALLGVGTFSAMTIPKESSPEVVIPYGVVTTVLPGAPAADVESLVTNELERGLKNLENVKEMTSVSNESVSTIMVEFEASADVDESIADLKDEVDLLVSDLPSDAEDPRVLEMNFVDQPIVTTVFSADLSDYDFNVLADEIEAELESVSGVSRVDMYGVRKRAVSVLVDQTELERYDLSILQVISGLQAANVTFPIGQIEQNGISYNIAFEGDIVDTEAVRNVAIAERSGQPVYVRDIATVEDGLASAGTLSRLSVNGEPSKRAITAYVYKRSGGDITRIAGAVRDRVEELQAPGQLLDGVETVHMIDMGDMIATDLIRLSSSGLQTVLLVVLLLVLAIGWREGLLAGLAIPLSFLIGFIGLYFSGNTINFLSLFSLILGIGILVDSAIVMVEGINRRMKDNPTINKREAASQAIYDFWAPLASGTLTTVAMFAGLFVVSGIIGQFISSIPFTLIFLLFASLFVSLAIIPLFASTFLHRRNATKFEAKQTEYARKLEKWYQSKLITVIDDPLQQEKFLGLLFAALVFALSLPVNIVGGLVAAPLVYVFTFQVYEWYRRRKVRRIFRQLVWVPGVAVIIGLSFVITSTIFPVWNPVKVIFFEEGDSDYIYLEIEKPEGTTKEVTDVALRRVEELLYDESDIRAFVATVGSGSEYGSGGSNEKLANILVTLKDDRSQTSAELVEALRVKAAELSDLKIVVNQPSDGPPTGAAIIVKFLGDDLTELTTLANEAARTVRTVPHTVNVETSTNNNSTEFVLNFDREKAAAYGLNAQQVSQALRAAVYGMDATSLTTLDEDIDVTVRMNLSGNDRTTNETANHATIDALERLTVPTASGPVSLSNVVDVTLRESSASISHEDGQRVVTVTADVDATGNARAVQAEVLAAINEQLEIPEGITLSTGGGETEDSNKAFIEMFLALIVGVALMVGVLVLQFNSYLHMRYVLSILPYSLIGIMVGLAITMNPLSFPSMMGFIALSGIVVNNSILLIDSMNQLRREFPAMPIRDAVLTAAGNRLRPILLTTATTVIGMIPLTYAGDMWAPLAYAVMFGLLFSVIITLILIPILYSRRPGELTD